MMVELAECKACGSGVLLPFYSPDGFVVYYCSGCRARFSGYSQEPMYEGRALFADFADYSDPSQENNGSNLCDGEMISRYRGLLDANPPLSVSLTPGLCRYCGTEVPEGSSSCTGCWMISEQPSEGEIDLA